MDDRRLLRRPSRWGGAAILATLALLLPCPPALGQQLSGSLALDVFEGDYGTDETTTAVAVTGTIALGRDWWTLSLQLPAYRVDGPATPFAGGRPLPPGSHPGGSGGDPGGGGSGDGSGGGGGGGGGGDGGGGGGGKDSGAGPTGGEPPDPVSEELDDSGLGDPLLRFEALLPVDVPRLSLFAAVKAPLERRLTAYGTGEWDAGAGVSAAGRVAGLWVRGEAAWWRLGDPPGVTIDDPWVARLSASRRLGGGSWWGSAAAEVSGETVPGAGTAARLELGVTRALGGGSAVGGRAVVGLTDAAPDLAASLVWSWE